MLPQRPRTAALPLAALLLLVPLAGCSDQAPASSDGPTRGSDPGGRTPSASEEPSATPTEDETSSTERTVAVYYVGDTGRAGPRLYREFQRGEGEALAAGLDALAGTPLDDDYRTLWAAGQLTEASYDGEVIDVVVDAGVRRRPAAMTAAEARAAVEQVIYTMQAAVQERAPVQFRTTDNPIDRVLGVPTSEPLANGPMLDVLSHVNLTTPEQGAVVDDGTLEISGVGNSFEANVGWEVRRGEEVVLEGFATMDGWMEPKLFPFETSADVSDLPPGDYTIWVTTDDPSGGTEGIGAMTDDKEFVVE